MAAEAAISSAVTLLGDLLIQKIKSLRGVEGKVESLKDELTRMQSFLRDANKKQYEDERVLNLISEIRELAQDAQDTIEMFLLNVENAKNRGLLERCTSFPKRMHHLDVIGNEIESLQDRLDKINSSREMYGIKDLGEAAESGWRMQVDSWRRLSPWKKDEHLVGVEDDVKKLLQESILYEEKKGLSLTVLEGMGGIGKSTLALKIYNHPEVVGGPFECRGWVVVSSEFTPQETFKQLIFQLQRSEEDRRKLLDEMMKLEESMKDKLYLLEKLKEMLHKQLEGKSYFIVLDDVWETQHLESLITAFPNQQDKASRILITTRIKIITKFDQYMHKMKLLDHDEGWELLLNKAFIKGKCPEELESVGRQILVKCDGLPLAISVVGGLLIETQTKSGWEKVLKHINSYLGRAKSSVSSILELSYQNLSPQWKSCFLWLAFFKEDSTIPAKRLVNIWATQGLIQEEGTQSIDEIGRTYLNELINRSMLQVHDLTFDGRVKDCRLHDLLREVCLRKAEEEIGLEIVKEGERISSHKPRHRVVYGKKLGSHSSNQNKHLRSLFLLNVEGNYNFFVTTPSNYWKSYQLLKTLDLDGFAFRRLPNSFRLLIGLKCLRIMHEVSTFVLELPSWLDHLINLEVLDMEVVEFPRKVSLKMESLRYIHARILRGPTEITSWKSIECLKHISHKDWLRYASNLTSGCHLRELGIHFEGCSLDISVKGLEGTRRELRKVRASLEKMQNLVILHLTEGHLAIEIALAMPNHLANLTKLKLRGKLPDFPAATMFPPNLSHLTLGISYTRDDPMAELGKLPKLSKLKMHEDTYMGEKMHVLCDGFPSLEALAFERLWYLKGIVIEEGGMPKLKHLRILKCIQLETGNLPEHINISTQ